MAEWVGRGEKWKGVMVLLEYLRFDKQKNKKQQHKCNSILWAMLVCVFRFHLMFSLFDCFALFFLWKHVGHKINTSRLTSGLLLLLFFKVYKDLATENIWKFRFIVPPCGYLHVILKEVRSYLEL